ncbi:hypothetical protein jhhlp_002502 [Lomentospora prolificans]|uniref:Protein kinase domain-containing protein n=1 Tax=Lomentospora prolificans TaxID=41688 RepID=A0A2N3NE78_9PEZI|nr:hypothetical protein jhhlp_002502 [Lomentospora prolificans]
MSGSPLVARPSDIPSGGRFISASPLKTTSAHGSSTSTPRPHHVPTLPPSVPPTLDLSEQMNEEEKRKYVRGKKLGEGTYAIVYLGSLRSNPSVRVAIKKIKVQKEYTDGLPPDAVREIKHLQELQHPNIISLLSVFSSKDQNLNLVLEYLPLGDLEMLIRDSDSVHYGTADIKTWMGMLTRAVWFCHENYVLHRDIKPNNLLIAADGEIKLADFGLARSFADPHQIMTSNVITRWYRPPELLFGAKHYSGAVDVWSVGCVFAELVLRNPYLPGETDINQIELVCRNLGTPTEDNWPGVSKLREYGAIPAEIYPVPPREHFRTMFSLGADGADLLMQTLTLDPKKRITAAEMLRHEWWSSNPKPAHKEDLPRKRGGEEKMGADLKRRPGIMEEDRGKKVARKLDFSQM